MLADIDVRLLRCRDTFVVGGGFIVGGDVVGFFLVGFSALYFFVHRFGIFDGFAVCVGSFEAVDEAGSKGFGGFKDSHTTVSGIFKSCVCLNNIIHCLAGALV